MSRSPTSAALPRGALFAAARRTFAAPQLGERFALPDEPRGAVLHDDFGAAGVRGVVRAHRPTVCARFADADEVAGR